MSARSAYFEKRFEEKRRATGERPLCLRHFYRTTADCCSVCGARFHTKIGLWAKPTANASTYIFDQLDPAGFEVYIQWLYSYDIPEYTGTADDRCIRMLRAHLVGNALDDEEFLLVVRNKIVTIAEDSGLSFSTVAFAYNNNHKPYALRRLLVDLYALTGSQEQLMEGGVSHLFLLDMAQSFMKKSTPLVEEYVQ